MRWSGPKEGLIGLELTRNELSVLMHSVLEGTQLDREEFRIRTGWPRDTAKELCDELGDALGDPRWRDQAEPRVVHDPPREPRVLAYQLFGRARRLPHDSTSLRITAWAIANSYGARLEYTHPDLSEPVDITMSSDAGDLLEELRRSTYEAGRGAWYNAVITIDRRVDPLIELDFDRRPAFPWPISAETCRADLIAFPRRPEHMPTWMEL